MTRRAHEQVVVFDGVSPALLNKQQVCRLLGDISISTFERIHNTGRLGPRPVRFGKRLVRWRRDELEAWIKAGLPWREVWEERSGRDSE